MKKKAPTKSLKNTLSNKTELLRNISYAVFELEESHGHLMWKVTDLVRKAKVSRSTIYAYLGSSKKQIFTSIFKVFLHDFYCLDYATRTESFIELLCMSHKRLLQHPEAIFFYQKWRNSDSWVKDEFVKVEKQFQNQLKLKFTHLKPAEILFLQVFIHGLVTAPFLPADKTEQIFEMLLAHPVFADSMPN